jgi:hypothetical protein
MPDKKLFLTVTDATLVTYWLHFDGNEVNATSEVIVIIVDPSINQNKIKKDALFVLYRAFWQRQNSFYQQMHFLLTI